MSLEVRIKKKLSHFTLDVNFIIENEVLALLGVSGCGKSMTLKCIAGIEKPDEGRIVLNNQVLYDSEKKINLPPQKRHVGYMFQDYALFPNMTVEENIGVGANRQIVHSYIEKFHLEGLEKMYPSKLSGGQKQRVALARMLATKPEVILLDEPFSALDSHLKWTLEQEMAETLKSENKPSIFVSHNRDEVYRICQKVACIDNGHTQEVCEVKEFFNNPKTMTAAVVSGCKNISPVEWIDDNHIKAIEWNVDLDVTNLKIQSFNDINYVGIRAHFLEPIYAESSEQKGDAISEKDLKGQLPHFTKNDTNVIWVADYKIIEDPFEWILMFKNEVSPNAKWLQWKCAKVAGQEMLDVPVGFRFNEANLLLLR